ncbi:MAG: TIGR04211 family SH3 domain-containing protein [Gammaproteobacteria bacterium]|nr:TIGR04211 family SH3 domain-containing protein [Gammaproteobacteria bacterium]
MRLFAALLLSFMLTGTSLAETVFVDDNLRVGVRPEPDNSYSPISVVVSGMVLEVLERKGNYMRIRTPSGVEGWVSSSYVTKKKPAQILLEEAREEEKALNERIEDLTARIEELSQSQTRLQQTIRKLETENAELKDQMNETIRLESLLSGGATPWWQNLIILILLILGAFGGGVLWYKRHLAKKLGGLSI